MDQIPPLNLKHFQEITIIGKGAHGIVYIAKDDRDETHYALKQTKKDQQQLFILAHLKKTLPKEFVIPIEQIIDKNKLYFKMELADGDIWDYVFYKGVLSSFQAGFLFRKLCKSISLLLKEGFLHHDIRPYNILMFDGDIKKARLGDFSLSIILDRYERSSWDLLIKRDYFMAFVTICSLMTKKKYSIGNFKEESIKQFLQSECFALAYEIFPPLLKLSNLIQQGKFQSILESSFWKDHFDFKRKLSFKSKQTKKATTIRKQKKIARKTKCKICGKEIDTKNIARHMKQH